MNDLYRLVSSFPRTILLVVGAITLFALFHLSSVTLQTDFEKFVDPQYLSSLHYIYDNFGINPSSSVTIEAKEEKSVLSLPVLKEQNKLFAEIEKRWPVHVSSLLGLINVHLRNVQDIRPRENGLYYSIYDLEDQGVIDNLIAGLYFADPYEFERLARKALSDESFIDAMQELQTLSSLTGGGMGPNVQFQLPHIMATRASITLEENLSKQETRRIFSEIRDFSGEFSELFTVRNFATELVDIDIDRRLLSNTPLVIGLMVILLLIVLYYTFRSWFFTLMPITILGLTIVWVLGFLFSVTLKEMSFNHIIAIPLLLGQCIDNLIHFNERFREEFGTYDQKKALKIVFNTAGRAAGLTTLINMTAFGIDYFFMTLEPMRHYALIVFMGIGLALLLTYTVGTASFMLASFNRPASKTKSETLNPGALKVFDLVMAHRGMLLVGSFLFLGIMLVMGVNVKSTFRVQAYMAEDFPTNEAYTYEQEVFTPYSPHYVLIKGENIANESTFAAIDTIESSLEGFPEVEHIHNQVNTESLNYLSSHFDQRSLPEEPQQLLEALKVSEVMINPLLGKSSADLFPDLVHKSENGSYDATLVKFWPADSKPGDVARVGNGVEQATSSYHDDLFIQATGNLLAFARTQEDNMVDFIAPTIVTLILIMIYLGVAYRRIPSIFITVVPVIFGAIIALGTLYLLDTELNSINGVVGILVVGLGIDYAIQIMMRYHEELEKQDSAELAMRHCFGHIVAPLGQCALLTSAGLVVLAGLLPVTSTFGITAGIAIMTAYLSAVLVMPIFAVAFVKKQ